MFILKFIWKDKKPESIKNDLLKEQSRNNSIPNLKTYSVATVVIIKWYQQRDRRIDEWNSIGNPYKYDRDSKTVEERQPFQQMVLEQLDICRQNDQKEINLEKNLMLYIRMNSKMNLECKCKTFLAKNDGSKSLGSWVM